MFSDQRAPVAVVRPSTLNRVAGARPRARAMPRIKAISSPVQRGSTLPPDELSAAASSRARAIQEFAAMVAERFAFLRAQMQSGKTGPLLTVLHEGRLAGAAGPMETMPDATGIVCLLPQYFGVLPQYRGGGNRRSVARSDALGNTNMVRPSRFSRPRSTVRRTGCARPRVWRRSESSAKQKSSPSNRETASLVAVRAVFRHSATARLDRFGVCKHEQTCPVTSYVVLRY
ncbi:hypothetical protein [Streptomyces sp. NBC_01571]|uniref:hypothetical protein n=1 Tax=Streptomyces sp. NBC_01571 TaxID=2975883 RepID=UPI002255E7D1|nr:hypothetical protein [Streptomyces sp. NBC_01571]